MNSPIINKLVGFVVGVVVGAGVTYFFAQEDDANSAVATTAGEESDTGSVDPTRPARNQLSGIPNSDSESTQDPDPSARRALYAEKLDSAMALSSRHDRLREFLVLLQEMQVGDGASIMQVFHRADRRGGQHPVEWDAFIRRWGEVDGAAAAMHIAGRKDQNFAKQVIPKIFSGWAKTDPDGAVALINSGDLSEDFADPAILGLISGVAESSLEDAVTIASQNIDSENSRSMVSRSMEAVAEAAVRQGGIDTLLETFGGLPDDTWKKAAAGHVWWRLKHSSDAQAAQWLKDNAEAEWANPTQYRQTIQEIARKNSPEEAMKWASDLPRGLVGAETARTFQAWEKKAPQVAQAWLENHPDDSLREFLSSEGESP